MTFGSLFTLVSWLLVVTPIAIAAVLFLLVRTSGSLGRDFGRLLRGPNRWLLLPAVVFLLVAGIGAVTSFLGAAREEADLGNISSLSRSRVEADGEMLARLKDYTHSAGTGEPVSTAAAKQLPDVNTMIDRLAARLEIAPGDIKGWRMLGWFYFHTGRYEQAATAYARAVRLDPNSAELKASYDEAKAKASETSASARTGGVGKDGGQPRVANNPEGAPALEHNSAIRAMVDGLAHRLESSPRDVEGWTRLMRSRVVLGEVEVATTALRKALEVFKADTAATGTLRAAAAELGLRAE